MTATSVRYDDTDIAFMARYPTYTDYEIACSIAGIDPASAKTWRKYARGEPEQPTELLTRSAIDQAFADGGVATLYESYRRAIYAERVLHTGPQVIYTDSRLDGWIGLLVTGDWHIGGYIDIDRLEEDLVLMRKTPGLLVGLNGDLIENFQRSSSHQDAMAETALARTQRQVDVLRHLMEHFGPDRYLFMSEGNHDCFGDASPVPELAERYQAHYIDEAGASLHLSHGSQEYVFYIKHQGRGGRNDGKNLLASFPDPVQPDATFVAHLHEPETHARQVKGRLLTHQRSGTYKLIDDYATRRGYLPEYGPSLVLLSPDRHECVPFPGPHWQRGLDLLTYLRSESP